MGLNTGPQTYRALQKRYIKLASVNTETARNAIVRGATECKFSYEHKDSSKPNKAAVCGLNRIQSVIRAQPKQRKRKNQLSADVDLEASPLLREPFPFRRSGGSMPHRACPRGFQTEKKAKTRLPDAYGTGWSGAR